MTDAARPEWFWTHPSTHHRLFSRAWSSTQARGMVVLIHGFGEHSGRYQGVAESLGAAGYDTLCVDLPGHGRSDGRRGDIADFREYLEALDAVAASQERPTGTRLHLIGHSFGGLVALHWALRHPSRFTCVALQSPLFAPGFHVPAWKRALAHALRRIWPTYALPAGFDASWISHDPEVVQAYRRDPLVIGHITARCYYAVIAAMDEAYRRAPEMTVPCLLLYSAADRIVSPAACERVFSQLTCEKRAVRFADAYHELHHEPIRAEALHALVSWMDAHPA